MLVSLVSYICFVVAGFSAWYIADEAEESEEKDDKEETERQHTG